MIGIGTKGRLAVTAGVGLVLLGTPAGPSVQAADPTPCRVHNATEDVTGDDLGTMVEAAVDGDHLRIRGTCAVDLVIDTDLTISGLGDPRPVLTGSREHRVVRIAQGATAALRHLTIRDGDAQGGGGICNWGTLTLDDVLVRGNRSRSGGGAGIGNWGRLTVSGSTIVGNSFEGDFEPGNLTEPASCGTTSGRAGGGGIANWGSMVVTETHLSHNWAGRGEGGGGILNAGNAILSRVRLQENTSSETAGGGLTNVLGGTLTLRRSVVRDNASSRTGGGIANGGTLTIDHSVVRSNWGYGEGGGILSRGDLLLTSSVVRGNTAHEGLGGGISSSGVTILRDSILRGNQVTGGGMGAGGGIAAVNGSVRLVASIVRANVARDGAGVWSQGFLALRRASVVTANIARKAGGGIWISLDRRYRGSVSLSDDSSVAGNTPDECHGTDAC